MAQVAWVVVALSFALPLHGGDVTIGWKADKPQQTTETGWTSMQQAAPSDRILMRFALKTQSPSALTAALAAISDPQSDQYRKYLTDSEVKKLVSPPDTTARFVSSWIHEVMGEDVSVELSKHGEYLLVSAQVGELQRAFDGLLKGFAVFRHDNARHNVVRAMPTVPEATPASLVPAALQEHVWAVLGLVELLPVPSKTLRSEGEPGDVVDPKVIQKQYGLGVDAVGGKTKTSQGVAAFEDAQFLPTDVAAFEKAYDLPSVVFGVNGPNDGGYYGEAGLDTQYIVSTGRGVPSWFLSQEQFDMLSFCELVLNMTKPPSVVSISWGSAESVFTAEHLQAATACFQKMGAQGISIFVASGDGGTGKQGFWGCKKFDVQWPASCPYVTAVGGTQLQSGTENGWAGSGGGFSGIFPRQSFQDKAVAAYMKSASLPASTLYNASGRAMPDVSALATNFKVYSGGASGSTLTGTSAACPTFAGMISVINDMLVAAGKPTVGFINPTLYASAAADANFLGFDVTSGNNKAGGCPKGFDAAKGWDPVTGLGTPVFSKLRSVLGVSESSIQLV